MKAEMKIERLGDGSFVGFINGAAVAAGSDPSVVARKLGRAWAEKIAVEQAAAPA